MWTVAHLAAPVSLFFTDTESVMKASVEATTSLFEAAFKEALVKVLLYMGFIGSIIGPISSEENYTHTEKDWNI